MREITIRPVLNGFVVLVGCQTLVFTSIEHVMEEIVRYHRDPESVEKEYQKNAVNKPQGATISRDVCESLEINRVDDSAKQTRY